MQKSFQGEVITTEDNTFTNPAGEVISLWKLVIALNEGRGMIFHFGQSHPQYSEARETKEGEIVRVLAEASVRPNGSIKWKAIGFEKVS